MQTSRRAFLACVPAALAVATVGLSAKSGDAKTERECRDRRAPSYTLNVPQNYGWFFDHKSQQWTPHPSMRRSAL